MEQKLLPHCLQMPHAGAGIRQPIKNISQIRTPGQAVSLSSLEKDVAQGQNRLGEKIMHSMRTAYINEYKFWIQASKWLLWNCSTILQLLLIAPSYQPVQLRCWEKLLLNSNLFHVCRLFTTTLKDLLRYWGLHSNNSMISKLGRALALFKDLTKFSFIRSLRSNNTGKQIRNLKSYSNNIDKQNLQKPPSPTRPQHWHIYNI